VGCPNRFYQTWISEHYRDPLTAALSAAGAGGASLELELLSVWPRKGSSTSEPPIALDPALTFDTFVTGPANRLAYEAARAVADQPGTLYNPLLIAGDVGEGKTHLLHAIGHAILLQHPHLSVRQVSANRLFELLVEAVQRDETASFRQDLRSADVLLMDNVHTLVGREGTQEEFFHAFNALHTAGRQLVFTSREAPASLAGIPDRIRSRLSWGLVVQLEPGDRGFRLALAEQYAAQVGWSVPREALGAFVAPLEVSNRELVGFLHRAVGICRLTDDKPETVFSSILAERQGRAQEVRLDDIIRAVSRRLGFRMRDLRGPRRAHPLTRARQVISLIAHEYADFSLPAIGRSLGRRDHTTILYSVRKARERMGREPDFSSAVRLLRRDLSL
jgi:chromosomal replication initiator protein